MKEFSPKKLLTAVTILGLCAIACNNLTPTPARSPLPTPTPESPAMTWVSAGGTTFELYNNQQDGLTGWQVNPQTFAKAIDPDLCTKPLAVNNVKIVISDAAHKKASDACTQTKANNSYCLGWGDKPIETVVSTSGEKRQSILEGLKVLLPDREPKSEKASVSVPTINSALISISPQKLNAYMQMIYSKENLSYSPTSKHAVNILNALLRQEINYGACYSLTSNNISGAKKLYQNFVNSEGQMTTIANYLQNPVIFLQPITSK
jgi:hypothetical protein